jgi:hypothetical protein
VTATRRFKAQQPPPQNLLLHVNRVAFSREHKSFVKFNGAVALPSTLSVSGSSFALQGVLVHNGTTERGHY